MPRIGSDGNEQEDDFEASPYAQRNTAGSQPDTALPARPFTTTAPPAFGMGSL
jgi:hypothetical protein